ncbi:MAG: hypothetical protein HZB92_01005 [Euryarchaeota archaeon]|nr:hypothetical protein [Euryarchaeota archaeon]
MNDDGNGIDPRKAFFAVIAVGAVVVACMSGVFYFADRAGVIRAQVLVSGYAQTNATYGSLYVDGVKFITQPFGGGYYDYSYYSYSYEGRKYFTFQNVMVRANAAHTFQVRTELGEESQVIEATTPYGVTTTVPGLSIEKKMVRITVKGMNNAANGLSLTLYVDGQYADNQYSSMMGQQYTMWPNVTDNANHSFRIQASGGYSYGYNYSGDYTNQTYAYVSGEGTVITLNLP